MASIKEKVAGEHREQLDYHTKSKSAIDAGRMGASLSH